jgi:hypothetical protein
MRMTVIEKKNGEQIGKYIYHPTDFCSYVLDEFKECVIEVGNKGTLTYYGEDKAIIRVYKNGVAYENAYKREEFDCND